MAAVSPQPVPSTSRTSNQQIQLMNTPRRFAQEQKQTAAQINVNQQIHDSINNHQDQGEKFNEKDKIKVVVRIRPINEIERQNGENEIISCDRTSLIVEGKQQARKFLFDSVFDPNSTQEEMFNFSGIKRLINMAIDGYICTCFAYGQTGSGKTYTMVGPSGTYVMNSQDRFLHFGLIPRSINYLFNQLRVRTQQSQSVFYIRVSYYEIYNEQIRDLINPNSGRKLEIRGSQEEGFFVDNLFATYIETMEEILTILQEGELNRATASHLLNEHSSRSHAILTIQVENELQNSQDPKEQITKLGKLIFVDLAGSEKVKVTLSKGKQLTETNNINKSLLVLGTCISALSDSSKREGHIPYRDSKLTKLLSESLGGTGITLMIACVSSSFTCENETLNTLRYANRAQNIENMPIMKSDSRENIVQKLKRELRKLKEENLTLKQQLGYTNGHITNHLNNVNNNISGRLPKIASTNGINSGRNGSSNSNASSESDLYGMLQEYIQENKTLKSENSQLEKFREKIRQQHEILTRENEKLARKLEQVLRSQGNQNSVEYVVLNNNSTSNIDNKSDGVKHVEKQIGVKALPRIEKQANYPVEKTNSLRSASPVRNIKGKFNSSNSTYSESTDSIINTNNSIEQIEIVKPSYTRKYKQIKDFKTEQSPQQTPVLVKKLNK